MQGRLYSPGSNLSQDASIELIACTEQFLQMGHQEPLSKWNVNGIEISFWDDFRDMAPEHRYYRFLHWQVRPGLWLYASIDATGRQRFEYTLSIFETLVHIDSSPGNDGEPLYERAPWNSEPSIYRLCKDLDDGRPLHDLANESGHAEETIEVNNSILAGDSPVEEWTVVHLLRKKRVLNVDCYYGPDTLFSSEIFSERFIELFCVYFDEHFTELRCTVDGRPFYFLVAKKNLPSCLDAENSQINRFRDGGIMCVERYRFMENLVADPKIFAVPEDRNSIFATQSILEKTKQAGLTGIAFHPVNGNGREYTCPR